jgi:hypothetical protein
MVRSPAEHRHPAHIAKVINCDRLWGRRWLGRAQAEPVDDTDDLGGGVIPRDCGVDEASLYLTERAPDRKASLDGQRLER